MNGIANPGLNRYVAASMNEETTLFKGSPTLWTSWGQIALAVVIMGGSGAAGFFLANPLFYAGIGVGFFYLLLVVLLVRSTVYEVTSQRIRVTTGILTKRTDDLELYRVLDAILVEPMMLRLVGCGTIEIKSADATTPTLDIKAVHGARALREELRKHVEAAREKKRVRMFEHE